MERLTEIIRYTLADNEDISTSDPGASIDHGLLDGVLHELHKQDMSLEDDVGVVMSAINAYKNGGYVDVKHPLVGRHHFYLVSLTEIQQIERIVNLAASIPEESKGRNIIAGALVKNLWETLDHPPLTRLGDQYKYRAADGSNSVSTPHLLHQKKDTDLI